MHTVDDQQQVRTVVRRAVVGDIPHMVMIGRRFIAESGYEKRGIHGNPNKLHESFERSISDDASGVFVVECAGVIIGVASAVKFTTYFSDAPMSIELFWWVDPAHRGGSAALRLMQALEDWSWASGCAAFSMVDIVDIDGPATSIYERRGFDMVERTWMKRNPAWQQ